MFYRRTGKKALLFFISVSVTAVLVYTLCAKTSFAQWKQVLTQVSMPHVAAYLFLFLFSIYGRAVRYSMLYKPAGGGAAISTKDFVFVTLIKNLFIDLLPARAGSLSYLVLLTKAYGASMESALATFSYAFIFDTASILPLFALVLCVSGNLVSWIFFGALLAGSALLVGTLDRVVRWARQALGRRLPLKFKESNVYVVTANKMEGLERCAAAIKASGALIKIFLLSLGLRALKYGYLFLLVTAFLEAKGYTIGTDSVWILAGLVAAEFSASLPFSGIAGFGLYEAVLSGILKSLGLELSHSLIISFGVHLITQTVDYSLGLAALFRLSFLRRGFSTSEGM